jgi:hypothetical protein
LARRENCSTGISNGEYLFACDSGHKTEWAYAFSCKIEQLVGGYAEIRVALKESEAVTIGKRASGTTRQSVWGELVYKALDKGGVARRPMKAEYRKHQVAPTSSTTLRIACFCMSAREH